MSPKADYVVLLAAVVAVSVAGWLLPEPYAAYVGYGLFACGLLFDVLSCFYHTMTLTTGKFVSGFPLVGLFFYLWFVLAFPRSLVAPNETTLGPLVGFKVLDAVLLVGLHVVFQSPMFLQGPRDQYK